MDQAITRATGAAPRAVAEFQGYVDGANGLEPSVRWLDRKNMPKVGDRLFAIPPRVAAQRSWSILLTSANHGTVGPLGSTFPHAGEHHERVVVTELVEAGAPPAPGVDLAGLVRFDFSDLDGENEQFGAVAGGAYFLAHEVEARCSAHVAAQAGQVAPTDDHLTEDQKWLLESAEMVRSGSYPDLASKIRVACKATVSAGQVAVPEGWKLVPVESSGKMTKAGEKALRKLLGSTATSLDADSCYAAMLAAAPAAPAQAKPLPAGWISVDERLPEGRYCLATYQDRAGKLRIIRAMYVRQFEIEASGDECDSETNEENDLEYLKAGWYEMIDNWGEYSSVHVSEGPVTHWTPLPALPDVQASTAGGRQEGGES